MEKKIEILQKKRLKHRYFSGNLSNPLTLTNLMFFYIE